jgi:hypothetical protein
LPSWKLASYDRLFNLYTGRYNRTNQNKNGRSGNPIWLQFNANKNQATHCALACAVSGMRFAWKVQYEERLDTSAVLATARTRKSLVLLSSVFEHEWLALADAISVGCLPDLSPMQFLTYARVDRLHAFPSLVLRRNVTTTVAKQCQTEVGRAGGLIVIVDDNELWQWADTATLSLAYNSTSAIFAVGDGWEKFVLCMHGMPIVADPHDVGHATGSGLWYTVDVKHDEAIIVFACMRRWLSGDDHNLDRASLWIRDGTQKVRQLLYSDFNHTGYNIVQEPATREGMSIERKLPGADFISSLKTLETLSTGTDVVASFLRTAAEHADVVIKCGLPAAHPTGRIHLVEVLETRFVHLTHTMSCLYALRLFCNSLVACTGWFWDITDHRVRTPTLMWTMPILWESAQSITQSYVNQVIDLMIPIKQYEWDVCSGGTILSKWKNTVTMGGYNKNNTRAVPPSAYTGSMSSAWWRQHSFASFTALPNVTTLSHPRFLVMSAGAYLPALSSCCRAMLLDFVESDASSDHDRDHDHDYDYSMDSSPATQSDRFMPNWLQQKHVTALHCFSGYAEAGAVKRHRELSQLGRNLRGASNQSGVSLGNQGTPVRSTRAMYHAQWNDDRLYGQGPIGDFENLITDSNKSVPWQMFFIVSDSVNPERVTEIRTIIMSNCPHLHSFCKLAIDTASVVGISRMVAIHTDPEIVITIYRWLVATKNLDVEFHSGGIFLPTESYTPREHDDCSYTLMIVTLMSAIVFMFMCWMLFKTRLLPSRVEPRRPAFRVPVVPSYIESPEISPLNEYTSDSDNEEENSTGVVSGESDTGVTTSSYGKQSGASSSMYTGRVNCNSGYFHTMEDKKSSHAHDHEGSDVNQTQYSLAYDAVVDELCTESNARLSENTNPGEHPTTYKKNT